jgi:hypothetical protein
LRTRTPPDEGKSVCLQQEWGGGGYPDSLRLVRNLPVRPVGADHHRHFDVRLRVHLHFGCGVCGLRFAVWSVGCGGASLGFRD